MPKSKTILIAEDNVALLKSLSVRLKSEGFNVVETQDGYLALDYCIRHRPDLVLMDINMPAGTGLSVQERMSKREELAGIPVVYMTGDTRTSIMDRAAELGAFAVLHKPIGAKELLAVVRAALDSDRSGRLEAA
jgi:DNA-binding response OmpR family regulator